MAEAKKAASTPEPKAPEPPKLAPAGASGNAGVQNLLAQRITHVSNGDVERTAEIDRELADLGFTAQ